MAALARSAKFYPVWYTSRWLGAGQLKSYGDFGRLATHLRYVERATRKLGRAIFHAMVRLGPKLERRQMVLFRAVDIGAELFAMAAVCSRAHMLVRKGDPNALDLADLFCREARLRIADHFRNLFGKHDGALYRVASGVLKGEYAWLERGIVGLPPWPPERTEVDPMRGTIEREAAGVGD